MTKIKIYLYIGIFVLIVLIAVGIYIYRRGKKKGSMAEFPTSGQGIPAGWSPAAVVEKVIGSMQGFGTDEKMLFGALDGLTPDQLAAVYNEFNHRSPGGETLFEWFRSELSGDDLTRALAYFSFIKT